jgi:endopolyphosphatase
MYKYVEHVVSNKCWILSHSFKQWWLPDLDDPAWEIEYATYDQSPFGNMTEEWQPISGRMITGDGDDDSGRRVGRLPFGLSDGTIGSWLKLAGDIGGDEEMQDMFYKVMYLGGSA